MNFFKKIVFSIFFYSLLAFHIFANDGTYQPIKMYGKWWMVNVPKGKKISKEVVKLLINTYNLKGFIDSDTHKIRPATPDEISAAQGKKQKLELVKYKQVKNEKQENTHQPKQPQKPQNLIEKLIEEINKAYEILGIDSRDNIEKAFRKLSLKWHPDKNSNNQEACIKYQKIVETREKLLKMLELLDSIFQYNIKKTEHTTGSQEIPVTQHNNVSIATNNSQNNTQQEPEIIHHQMNDQNIHRKSCCSRMFEKLRNQFSRFFS